MNTCNLFVGGVMERYAANRDFDLGVGHQALPNRQICGGRHDVAHDGQSATRVIAVGSAGPGWGSGSLRSSAGSTIVFATISTIVGRYDVKKSTNCAQSNERNDSGEREIGHKQTKITPFAGAQASFGRRCRRPAPLPASAASLRTRKERQSRSEAVNAALQLSFAYRGSRLGRTKR